MYAAERAMPTTAPIADSAFARSGLSRRTIALCAQSSHVRSGSGVSRACRRGKTRSATADTPTSTRSRRSCSRPSGKASVSAIHGPKASWLATAPTVKRASSFAYWSAPSAHRSPAASISHPVLLLGQRASATSPATTQASPATTAITVIAADRSASERAITASATT